MAQIIGTYGQVSGVSSSGASATVNINSPEIQSAVKSYIDTTRDTGFTITQNATAGYYNLNFHRNMGGPAACKGEDITGRLTSLTKYYTDHPEQRLAEQKATTIRTTPRAESPAQRTPAAADRPVITLTNDDLPGNKRTSSQRTESSPAPAVQSAPAKLSEAEIDSLLPEMTATLESKGLKGWTISREGLTFRATKEFGGKQTTVEETAPSALKAEIERTVTDSVMSLRRAMEMEETDWKEANTPKPQIVEESSIGTTVPEEQAKDQYVEDIYGSVKKADRGRLDAQTKR